MHELIHVYFQNKGESTSNRQVDEAAVQLIEQMIRWELGVPGRVK